MNKEIKSNEKEIMVNKSKKIFRFAKLILFVFLIAITYYIFSNYLMYQNFKNIIKNKKSVKFSILDKNFGGRHESASIVISFNDKIFKVNITDDEYLELNYNKPKLYYNKNNKKVFSNYEIEAFESNFKFLIVISIILIFPYKRFALLIMKIKFIHNFVKNEEPNVYQIYLDTINKKKK